VVDVFEEVEEQLRSDRYRTFALKYLPWIGGGLLAALLVAVGVWGYQQYRQGGEEKASQTYAAGLDSLAHGDKDQAYQRFGEVANSTAAAYKSLALMQQAGIRMDQQRTADAVALFDQAAKAAPNPIIGDEAHLKSALAVLDTASVAEIQEKLKPLTATPETPYNALAREAVAMAKLRNGDTKGARDDFVVLTLLPSAPDSVRQRAQAAKALIDSGSTAGVAAIVKAGLALPPAPLTQPAAPQMGPGGPPQPAPDQQQPPQTAPGQAPAGGAAQ
jgi:hypothetical protein